MAATKLRLFNTVDDGERARKEAHALKTTYLPHVNGSSKWGLFHALTSSWPLALSNLVLLASDPDCTDQVLLRFRDHLVPSWRVGAWTIPYFSWHYQNFVEYGMQGGVPGLCAYTAARSRWMDDQIKAGVGQGAQQIILLRPGYDSRPYRMRFPHVKFYEVDDAEAHQAKKSLLEAVLPNRNLHPRPVFVNVDWGNLATLIPALTAAGYDPGARAVFVAEGLMAHLAPEAVDSLLSDISALAAPGSSLCFDFLHEDVLEGRVQPAGYANLAEGVANKGQPFLNGMRPVYSATVRTFQPYNMRVVIQLTPTDISAWYYGAATGDRRMTARKEGTSRCTLVAGLAGGMPRYLSFAAVVKGSARLSLRDAPQQAKPEALVSGDGRPDTVEGGSNCFIASLMTLICGSGTRAEPAGARGGAAGGAKCAGGTPRRCPPPNQPPSHEPSHDIHGDGAQAPHLMEEQSSDWYLRADTEATELSGPTSSAHAEGHGPQAGQASPFQRQALDGLDRAQSILPQSSSSSLSSAAAAAVAAAAATTPFATPATAPAPALAPSEDRAAVEQHSSRVQDLRQLFNSLAHP